MNILFLHSSSDLYGASKIMLLTIKALKKNGHNCIVCLSEDGLLCEELKKNNIDYHIVNLGILRKKYFNPFGLINRILFIFLAIIKLSNIINKYNIRLVYSNTTAVLAGSYAAFFLRKKHLWHIHEIINRPLLLSRFLTFHMKYLSDKNIVVSNEVKKNWNNIDPKVKIEVIHNGIIAELSNNHRGNILKEAHKLPSNSLIVGMIGRVHYWKGQNYFIDLAHEISKINKNAYFFMVGDTFPGYEYLYEEIKEKILTYDLKRIIFDLGYRRDVPDILNAFDILVLPSLQPDPFPTVILEAMSQSKPIIATAQGGALEMIDDGKTGFLIPWDDSVKAVNKAQNLILNENVRKEMGSAGKEKFSTHFSYSTYEEKIKSCINSLINENSDHRQ